MPPLQKDFVSDSEHSQIEAVQSATDSDLKVAGSLRDRVIAPYHETSKSVKFGYVRVREYQLIVGDHPDVKVGPPLSLGWGFVEHGEESLEDYELRSNKVLKRMSSITRKNLLSNVFGVSEEEIRLAEKEVQLILKSRDRCKRQAKLGEKTGGTVRSATRKIKKVLLGDTFMRGLVAAAGAMMTPMGPGGAGMAVY